MILTILNIVFGNVDQTTHVTLSYDEWHHYHCRLIDDFDIDAHLAAKELNELFYLAGPHRLVAHEWADYIHRKILNEPPTTFATLGTTPGESI
jgi:hypothetical protein|tara:strand:- start:728 stop:1006 length:279 start_codon:yes stop_codon:yes gene_type:complete